MSKGHVGCQCSRTKRPKKHPRRSWIERLAGTILPLQISGAKRKTPQPWHAHPCARSQTKSLLHSPPPTSVGGMSNCKWPSLHTPKNHNFTRICLCLLQFGQLNPSLLPGAHHSKHHSTSKISEQRYQPPSPNLQILKTPRKKLQSPPLLPGRENEPQSNIQESPARERERGGGAQSQIPRDSLLIT